MNTSSFPNRPSPKSHWESQSNTLSETVILNRGSLEWKLVLFALVLNVVCNGCVVWLGWQCYQDFTNGDFQWHKVVVLIPFAIIGMVFAGFLLVLLLEPFRKIEYRFSDSEIRWSFQYFGIGRSKRWPLKGPVAISVFTKGESDVEFAESNSDECIRFSCDGEEVTSIDTLTLKEAKWIATELETNRAAYTFSKKTQVTRD